MSTESTGDSPWGRTLAETNGMAERLQADGWDVVTVRAAHVVPLAPGEAGSGRPELVYVAPNGVAESLPAAVERGDLEHYEAFRRRVGSDLFLLLRVSDPKARITVLLVGGVDLSRAGATVEAARECETLHSRIELLDGTHLAAFRHDDPTDVLPGSI